MMMESSSSPSQCIPDDWLKHEEYLQHAVIPPIFLSSNYTRRTGQHPNRTQYSYSRGSNPNSTALSDVLGRLYRCQPAILACSGMSALSITLREWLSPRVDRIVYVIDVEMYCDTTRLVKDLAIDARVAPSLTRRRISTTASSDTFR